MMMIKTMKTASSLTINITMMQRKRWKKTRMQPIRNKKLGTTKCKEITLNQISKIYIEGEVKEEAKTEAKAASEQENRSNEKEVAHPIMRYKVLSILENYWSDLVGAMRETEMKVYNMMNEYY